MKPFLRLENELFVNLNCSIDVLFMYFFYHFYWFLIGAEKVIYFSVYPPKH